MPRKVASAPQPYSGKFRRSLARRTVLQILLLALLPVLLVSGSTLWLTQQQITNQLNQQFQSVSQNYSTQLTALFESRQKSLNSIENNKSFNVALDTLLTGNLTQAEKQSVEARILELIDVQNVSSAEQMFDHVAILTPSGDILLSTNPEWKGLNISQNTNLQRMVGSDDSRLVFNPAPLYTNQVVLVTPSLFASNDLTNLVTIMGFTVSNIPSNILSSITAYFPTGQAYLYTADKNLITYDQYLQQLTQITIDLNHQSMFNSLTLPENLDRNRNVKSLSGTDVVNYTSRISAINTYTIIEVPRRTYRDQLTSILKLNLQILAAAMLVVGTIVYFSTRRLVRPIVTLADISQAFAKGDWSQRAPVTRGDEIGLLSSSFNQMVDQLTDVYRSLEFKVEERTQQLRTASEVAQIATSTSEREAMAQRTAQLITERFGYHFAAIFLLDETGNFATIKGISGDIGQTSGLVNHRVVLENATQLQNAVTSNQPVVNNDLSERGVFSGENVLQMIDSQSQALIPIAVGDRVLGIIDIQSKEFNAFDQDTVNVFKTLSNQIATGLRNIILLESAQVNLEETNLVYRASRQIAQADNENAITNAVTDALSQTNYASLLLDVHEDHLQILALRDKRGTRLDSGAVGLNLPVQKGIERLAENRVLITENLMAPSEFASVMNFFLRRDCKSVAIFPILVDGKPAKALALGSRETAPLNSTTLQPYSSLAEVISNSLNRLNVTRSLSTRLNELEMLAAISQAVSSETNLKNIYRLVQQQFTERLGSDLGFIIAIYDEENQMVELPYGFEDGAEIDNVPGFPLGEGFSSHIIRTGEPILVTRELEKVKSKLGSKTIGKAAKSILGAPMMIGGKVIGAILIQDNAREERFTQDDLHLLTTVASPVANVIRNAQLLTDMQNNLTLYSQEHYLLNTLLQNIPEQIFIKDAEGKYLRVSQSFEKAVNRPAADLLNKTEVDLQGEPGQLVIEEEQAILASMQPEIRRLNQIQQPDGSDQWILSSRIPLLDAENKANGLLGINEDITELKLTEQLAQRRADQLRTAAAVARDTAGTLEMQALLKNSVNVIRDRYGFYHAGIFLLDALGENAILQEATGEAGEKMKEASHKLAVGSLSIVGRTASTRNPVVSNDVRKELSYFPNPLLPNTRSEVGIPLVAGEELLGVLDVQSEKANAFLEEDISILQTVADQLSIALMNARLYAQTQEHLAKHRLLHHITAAASGAGDLDTALATTVQSLRAALPGDQVAIYFMENDDTLVMRASAGYTGEDVFKTSIKLGEGIVGAVAQDHRPLRVNDIRTDPRYLVLDAQTASEIAVPILFNEQLLGVLNIESPRVAAYDENDQEILATLGNNLASIIANTKLVEQVRVQVEHQRQLYDITSKIRRSTDLRVILETSASEIGRLLRANAVKIQVKPEDDNGKPQEEKE